MVVTILAKGRGFARREATVETHVHPKRDLISRMITSFIMREIHAREEAMTPPDQLPALVQPTALTTLTDSRHLVPALIADAGEPAAWRYIEFFTANIRNPNTRRAYARACNQFFAWCEDRGLTLTTIRPSMSPHISRHSSRPIRRRA